MSSVEDGEKTRNFPRLVGRGGEETICDAKQQYRPNCMTDLLIYMIVQLFCIYTRVFRYRYIHHIYDHLKDRRMI